MIKLTLLMQPIVKRISSHSKFERLITIILLLITSANGTASFQTSEIFEARTRLFEAWVSTVIDEQSLKGVSVSLVLDQELVYAKGFGFSDKSNDRATTADTIYRVGSITKLFTSIALMQLVESGKLSLSTPVIEIIPELSSIQKNGYEVNEITIRSILTHTTGLPTHPKILLDKHAPPVPLTLDYFLQLLPKQELILPSNRIHKYSNLAMNLGGVIIERTSGLTYEQYIRKFLLSPLKMNNSFFPSESHSSKVSGFSRSFRGQRLEGEFPEMSTVLGVPASGLLSNSSDLAKFLSWHFHTLKGSKQSLLRQQTLKKMQQVHWVPIPITQPPAVAAVASFLSNLFGLGGTGLGYFRDREFTMHSGGLMGFTSEFVMDNQNELGIAALANSVDAPLGFNNPRSITRNLYEIVGSIAANHGTVTRKLKYPEYEGVYTDNHNWSFYVTEIDSNLVLLNLFDGRPLEKPIILSSTGEDRFVDPAHKGFYVGEFFVQFNRDESGEIDALFVNTEKLYRRNLCEHRLESNCVMFP